MPEITATGYRNRILAYAKEHGHTIGPSKAMRLAVGLAKRQVRMSDLDLEQLLTYNDPTPRKAFKRMEAAA